MSGYSVRPDALRGKARVYEELERNAKDVRDELRAAFDQDRSTLGNDMYGAELAKEMPGIEQRVFGLLKEYLDELDLVASDLHLSAGNYEWAEHLSVDHN